MAVTRQKPVPAGQHLRLLETAGKGKAWYLGGRKLKQNDQLLLQLVRREEYVVRGHEGRNVCTQADRIAVRVLLDPGTRDRLPGVTLVLPIRDGGAATRIPATTGMHFHWPGPGVTR